MPWLVTAALLAGTGTVAGAMATRHRFVQGLDDRLEAIVGPHRSRFHRIASIVTLPGEWFAHPVIGTVVVTVLLIARGGPATRFVLPLAVASLGAIAAHHAVKFVYRRARPEVALRRDKTEAAYPSGHTTNTTAVLATSAFLLVREGVVPVYVAVPCVAAIALATGTSRVVLGWHWSSDVVGGWFTGVAVAAMCSAWYEALSAASGPA